MYKRQGCENLGPELICHAPSAPVSSGTAAQIFEGSAISSIKVPYGCENAYCAWAEDYKIVPADEKVLTVAVTSPGDLEAASVRALSGQSDKDVDTLVVTGNVKLSEADMTYLQNHFLRATTIDLSGVTVDKCRAHSFENRTALKKIVLPDSVSTIGDSAFQMCIRDRCGPGEMFARERAIGCLKARMGKQEPVFRQDVCPRKATRPRF